ncbi:hypothetical protein MLD38_001541 [Melastoma candidum]|uniref:Uncharacterized protein n=1 Tax=Melastoma candidum TaxID=119954 RepID=A0ACB9SE09_9MYRT|nr:hypothetical protein MLD38_001541 [Melastoma candidum]
MSRSNKIKSFLRDLVVNPLDLVGGPRKPKAEEDWDEIAAREQKRFPFDVLVAATRDFSPAHKLGQGGFGPVYRGRLEDGRDVAVKRLSQTSNQGKKEFTNEARLLARVQHRNVVNLVGYCAHGSEKLLVYEYIPNESLDKILFRSDGGRRAEFDWKKRYDVILGVARGLLYLHEDSHDCIIHRDIKAGNVLLDDKWIPKIADFGMARLFPEDQGQVQTRIAGTNGYMAPEYAMHGRLTKAADVFSFGVLVLEIVAGRRNHARSGDASEAPILLDWAYKMHKKGKSLEIVDPLVASTAVPEQAVMCIQIGLLCTQQDPQLRPSMGRVVLLLSKKPVVLDEQITRPGIPGRMRNHTRHRPRSSSSSNSTSSTTATNTFESRLSTGTASASASASASTQN